MAARTTTGWPLVTPPSRPPALLERAVKPASRRRGSRRGPRSRAAAPPRSPCPISHALDRLDRAERPREPAVEPPVPLHVGAEADRAAQGDDLEDAAQRVAGRLGRVDGLDHGAPRRRDRRSGPRDGLRAPPDLLPGEVERADAHAADLGDVAQDRDAELREQPLGRLPRRRPAPSSRARSSARARCGCRDGRTSWRPRGRRGRGAGRVTALGGGARRAARPPTSSASSSPSRGWRS